jgi:energy-coupling factor transporter ATP-binding protein EcfA2
MPIIPIPKPQDRAVFIGDTGSGKTTLMERMAALFENVQYMDLKREFQPQIDYRLCKDLSKAWDMKGQVLIRPDSKLDNPNWYDYHYKQIWNIRKNVLSIVDETYLLGGMHSISYPPNLAKLATVGRSKKDGLWCGIQRPKFAPTTLWAVTTFWYIFHMLESDIKVLKEWLPIGALDMVRNLKWDYSFVCARKQKGVGFVYETYPPLKL